MHAYSCFDIATSDYAKTGNHAEAKNLNAGEGIKSLYSIHTGDSDTGSGANTGRGRTIANHDGKKKYCIATGDNVPAGRNINSAVFAIAQVNIHTGVGSITIKEAFENVSGTVCVCQKNTEGRVEKHCNEGKQVPTAIHALKSP